MPKNFKNNFKECVCFIVCSEIIFTIRPKNLTATAQTWSNYKLNNTLKYSIGITPAGAISFFYLWDVEAGCWINRLLKNQVFSLKFPREIVYWQPRILILKISGFMKGKKQLAGVEKDTSRQISIVWIYVEHVIGRIKKIRLLQTTLPLTKINLLDDIKVIVCGLVNMSNSLVPSWINISFFQFAEIAEFCSL